jgi:hypothetical protein
MSRRIAFAVAALILSACGQSITNAEVSIAQQQCAERGGWETVARYEHGRDVVVTCKDGARLEIRP